MADVTAKRYASAGLPKKKVGISSSDDSGDDDLDMVWRRRSQAGGDRKELD
jgi:hypothetical protein